jgi:PAS domain S-box-containing protein
MRPFWKVAGWWRAAFAVLLIIGLLLVGDSLCFCEELSSHTATVRLPVVDATDLLFTRISFGQGTSHGRVQSIVQDKQGFLWFGTNSGLQRYDGYRFREFRHDPKNPSSLSGSAVRKLFEDPSGKLWLTSDQFLDRYDPSTETFTNYRFEFSGAEVLSAQMDRQGTVWLCTADGLYRLNPATRETAHYVHRPGDSSSLQDNVVIATLDTRDGTFWVATQDGVAIFDRETGRVIRSIHIPGPHTVGVFNGISLFEDHAGILWITSEDGLNALDPRTAQLIRYSFAGEGLDRSPLKGIRTVLEDGNRNLWLGTANYGILKIDRDRKQVLHYGYDTGNLQSLSSDQVIDLKEDREGNIWVGTTGGGLNRFASRPLPFTRYRHETGNPNSLESDYTSSVYEDSQGALWIGSVEVLTRIDRKTGKYTFYRKAGSPGDLSSTWVLSAIEDRDGFLWFGTLNGGLNRFDPRTGRFKVYRHTVANPQSLSNDTVYGLSIDHRGVLWAATGDGMSALDPRTGKFRVYRVPGDPLTRYRVVAEDASGALWLATMDRGLYRFDPATGQFTIYRHDDKPGSLSSNRVDSICISRSGTIWAGTENGLNRFDPTSNTFITYYERDGLADSAISGVLEDEQGNLWVSTGNGVSRFEPRTKTFKNYYTSDGLLSNEFYNYAGAYKSPSGEMFFNSYAGVIGFFPDKVIDADRPYVPPVVITDFQLFGTSAPIGSGSPLKQSISFTDSVTLTHAQSIFSFQFAALNYAGPEWTRYRYRLEGLEEKWNETESDRRSATYTTLPPGNYVFQVQARTNRGGWGESGAHVRIQILPPWWRTWWFVAVCVLTAVTLVWALYQWRIRQVRRQERKLRDVIETIPSFAWTALPNGSVEFVNRHWQEYTGLSTEKTVGSGWEAAVHPEDIERYAEKWRAAVASSELFESEVRFRRAADAQYRWFLTRAVPLRDARGKIVKWYGTSTDIEDRKRAEQLQADLAHINRVTTMGELTASLAHELKQPIAATITNANTCFRWLKRDQPDLEEACAAAERIVVDQKRAADMIEHLRSLYKKSPPNRESVDVNEIIREMVALLRGEANRYAVSMRADIAAGLPRIAADRVQLQQVLMNLMLNAIEAMKETGGILTASSQLDGDAQLLISVSDTGEGLPAEKADQIFDAFFTTKTQGSGMGLAISRSIIESHGGRLWATANDGRGATFHFTLPAAAERGSRALPASLSQKG